LAGAAVLGLLFSMRPAKKKVVFQAVGPGNKKKGLLEAGFLVAALKLVGTMLRPAITSYLTSRIAARSSARRW
jgi:hypothetical protein